MKKLCALFLVCCILLLSCGCSILRRPSADTANFYYLRTNPSYSHGQSLIFSEARDTYGRGNDLSFLLLQYFMGPVSTELYSPFPAGTSVTDLVLEDHVLSLTLSNARFSQQSRLQTALCFACLAKTCAELAEIDTIVLQAKDAESDEVVEFIFSPGDFILLEDSLPAEIPEELQ